MKYIFREGDYKELVQQPRRRSNKQAKNLANLPFIFKQVCLMPDTHEGYGMPIGGVIATDNVIIPNAVGVDIGCGMLAVQTSLEDIDTETLKVLLAIFGRLYLLALTITKRSRISFMPDKIDCPVNKLSGECAIPSRHSAAVIILSKYKKGTMVISGIWFIPVAAMWGQSRYPL